MVHHNNRRYSGTATAKKNKGETNKVVSKSLWIVLRDSLNLPN